MRGLILASVLISACTTVSAVELEDIKWSDLPDPTAQSFKDPYRELNYEQLDDLRSIVDLRARLESNRLDEETRLKSADRLVQYETELAADGIDVEWILSQRWGVAERREAAMLAGNPELDGRTVTLSGYAIPAPPDADGNPIAYLVPEMGMCSHTPPPAPNQLLRLKLTGEWKPNQLHEPVRVTGRISIDPSIEQMHLIDGFVVMHATFALEVLEVEVSEESRARLGWVDPAWLERARNFSSAIKE